MGIDHAAGPPEVSGQAIAAMVCGIVGLFIFGIILGPIAICLGAAAKQQIQQSNGRKTGDCQATAGIVTGSIAVVIWIILVILYFGAA
jgi:uncharacterized Tic20 family protein